MSDDEAKRVLRDVLGNYSVGSVLHLLSELTEEDSRMAQRSQDDRRAERLGQAADALFVVGLGLHAVLPG